VTGLSLLDAETSEVQVSEPSRIRRGKRLGIYSTGIGLAHLQMKISDDSPSAQGNFHEINILVQVVFSR
jgi:hypothetical protein